MASNHFEQQTCSAKANFLNHKIGYRVEESDGRDCNAISVRVLLKDRTLIETASNKQITDQYTNVCHMVKTLERETIHGPSQIATWSNLLCKRKKVT